jgi:hypothetical protein
MSDEARVHELLGPFAERQVDLDGREFVVNRTAAVDAILRASRSEPRARVHRAVRWGAAVAGGLAVAAAALLFWGHDESKRPAATLAPAATVGDVAGSVTHWQGATARALPAGGGPQPIDATGELRTGVGASVRLSNARGDDVVLFEESRLAMNGFGGAASGVQLLAGSIRCDVAELPPGRRFSVVTPQGTVEMRGAAVSLLVTAIVEEARTCVRVERGSVAVFTANAETRISAGQSWGCEPRVAPSVARDSRAQSEARPLESASPDTRGRPANERAQSAIVAGTLDEENRLFQLGLAAERRRDVAAADEALVQLLTRFPKSPLANDARRARERLQQIKAPAP